MRGLGVFESRLRFYLNRAEKEPEFEVLKVIYPLSPPPVTSNVSANELVDSVGECRGVAYPYQDTSEVHRLWHPLPAIVLRSLVAYPYAQVS